MTQALLMILLLGGVTLVTVVCWAWLLSIGLNWAKAENVTKGKLALATLLTLGVGLIASLQFSPSEGASAGKAMVFLACELFISIALPLAVIALIFRLNFRQVLKAWVVTLFASVSGLVLAIMVFKPFVSEAFVVNANSMAPTLVGKHLQGVCPECGSVAYCSPPEQTGHGYVEPPAHMICGSCFDVSEPAQLGDVVQAADRFAVAKYLEPKRWDLVAFRFPSDPAMVMVKRVVGLPGEQVVIKDGGVWINGTKLDTPTSIAEIEYLDAFPAEPSAPSMTLSGTEENPAQLGTDEYFVLGDFSINSFDSRLWSGGNNGWPSYAVPKENIVGVVTQIYWPPERWRAFR